MIFEYLLQDPSEEDGGLSKSAFCFIFVYSKYEYITSLLNESLRVIVSV
jgi:hypothetical protein